MARWPLTLRTSAEGPYDDHFTRDDLLLYAHRGTDPHEPDNVRLRNAMRLHVPLITARVAPISISRSAGSAPGEASPAGLEASATRAFAPRPEGDR